jgi:hypothetical protein
MSDQDDIKRLIVNYQRRLQKLKEAQALQGINTPPDVLIQIEDIEAELEKFQTALTALQDDPSAEPPHRSPTGEVTALTDPNPSHPLIQQLLSALKEDPDFAAELAALLKTTPTAPSGQTNNVTASGGGIAIGGNVGGSIVFGNNNTVIGNNSQADQE